MALVVLALAAGGCGGPAPAGPELPGPAAATFVGRSGDGVAASVDLAGTDATASALEAALAQPDGEPVAIGIASILNGRDTAVRVPRFLALGPAGTGIALVPARDALEGRTGAAAAAARAALPPFRRTIAPDRTALAYLVLRGVRPAEVTGVRMRLTRGDPVTLAPRGG